jgi:hypothetical protein
MALGTTARHARRRFVIRLLAQQLGKTLVSEGAYATALAAAELERMALGAARGEQQQQQQQQQYHEQLSPSHANVRPVVVGTPQASALPAPAALAPGPVSVGGGGSGGSGGSASLVASSSASLLSFLRLRPAAIPSSATPALAPLPEPSLTAASASTRQHLRPPVRSRSDDPSQARA